MNLSYFFCLKREKSFSRRFYRWILFCLQCNSPPLSFDVFPSSDAHVLKHHYALQL